MNRLRSTEVTDKIEIETLIEAPKSEVWDVVTKPEHIAQWFGCIAEFELKPGATGRLIWKDHGEASLTVVEVDAPNLFSFRWISADEVTQNIKGETLVTFTLSEVNGTTRLLLTESGFDQLDLSDADRDTLRDKHTGGWGTFAIKIKENSLSAHG